MFKIVRNESRYDCQGSVNDKGAHKLLRGKSGLDFFPAIQKDGYFSVPFFEFICYTHEKNTILMKCSGWPDFFALTKKGSDTPTIPKCLFKKIY